MTSTENDSTPPEGTKVPDKEVSISLKIGDWLDILEALSTTETANSCDEPATRLRSKLQKELNPGFIES